MTSAIVLILVCLAVSGFLLTATSAFVRISKATFGRLFIISMAASIGGTLILVMFLPGQRHVSTTARNWFDRSMRLVLPDRVDRAHREAVRMNVEARAEAARVEAEVRSFEAETDFEESSAESDIELRTSVTSPPAAPKAPVATAGNPPDVPRPNSGPADETFIRSVRHESGSRLVALAVSGSLLAAFLFVGYLFLDSGTRGHFTWSLRITMLAAFLAASAMLMIWK
jgi:hypothetical protein